MTPKPMYETKVLIGLCLLMTTAIEKSTGYATMKTIAKHEISGGITEVAPQMLDDQKFAILIYNRSSSRSRPEISVKVVGPNYNGRKCTLPVSVRPYEFNRVSRKTIVLSIFASNENARSPLKLLLVNTDDCTIRYAYDGVLPQWINYVFTSTNSSDERFTLIVSGKRYCGESEWCRLHFDPIYRKREALDFDFSPKEPDSIEPATESFDSNLFVVQVSHLKTNMTSIRLYDLSSNRTGPLFTEMLTPNEKPEKSVKFLRVTSMGLSYCLHVTKSLNDTRNDQRCVRFREDGTVMINETIPSPGVVLYPQTVRNGLILFSEDDDCYLAKWCKTVQVTVVTRDSDSKKGVKFQHRKYNLKCNHVPTTLKVKLNDTTNTIKYLEYLCQDDSHVSSRIIYEH